MCYTLRLAESLIITITSLLTLFEKQPKAQYIHLNGVKASAWNTTLNLSLITVSGEPVEFPVINFELGEGEIDLTTLEWVNEGQGCTNNLGLDTDAPVYGTDAAPADGNLSYVDITDYKTLNLYGRAGDMVRLFINRAEYPENFQFVVDLDENGIGTFNIASVYSTQEGAEYVHLNGIKMQWGTPEGKVKIELIGLTEKDFELPEGETDITTLEWVNEGQACDNRIGEDTDATVYGTHDGPANGSLSYVDITSYNTLKVYGRATDVVRCFINRAEYSDGTFQFYVTIGEDGVGTLDLAEVYAAQEGAEYVHLNGVKTAAAWQGSPSGKALVKAITLVGEAGEVAPQPICTTIGHATTCSWTGSNLAPAENITVESYDGYVVLKNWGGTEGYDLKVDFDADGVVTGVCSLYDGEDYTDYTYEASPGVWTGSDQYYYAYVYLGGYSFASDNNGSGYVCLNCYAYDSNSEGSYIYYYVQWPLTAEELTAQIQEAYDADVAQVQEWTNALAELQETYPFYEKVEAINDACAYIAQEIQSCYANVQSALEAASVSWGYSTPLTGYVITNLNELIIAAVADCEQAKAAIMQDYENAVALVNEYTNNVSELYAEIDENFPAYWNEHEEELIALNQKAVALTQACETALGEADQTGVYIIPAEIRTATDELLAIIEAYNEAYAAIENAAMADAEKLAEYAAIVMPYTEDYEAANWDEACTLYQYLADTFELVGAAQAEALNETAVYVSPLTDEVIAYIEAGIAALKPVDGINGIANDNNDVRYFDLNGQAVKEPVAGKVYIRVANGKSSKVLVK